MNLSPHFTYEELIHTTYNVDNTPTPQAAACLGVLVSKLLEPARISFGHPITISSGFRSPELNDLVKGAKNSQHLTGCAADLQVSSKYNLRDLFDILSTMDFDQLLYEHNSKGTQWIHISYNPDGSNRHYLNNNYKV